MNDFKVNSLKPIEMHEVSETINQVIRIEEKRSKFIETFHFNINGNIINKEKEEVDKRNINYIVSDNFESLD